KFDMTTQPIAGKNYIPIPGDFNGGGNSDIFWYVAGAETDKVSYFGSVRGNMQVVGTTNVGNTCTPVPGDFNGDGKSDIFWYAPGGTAEYVWTGSSTKGSFSSKAMTVGGNYTPLPRVIK